MRTCTGSYEVRTEVLSQDDADEIIVLIHSIYFYLNVEDDRLYHIHERSAWKAR